MLTIYSNRKRKTDIEVKKEEIDFKQCNEGETTNVIGKQTFENKYILAKVKKETY